MPSAKHPAGYRHKFYPKHHMDSKVTMLARPAGSIVKFLALISACSGLDQSEMGLSSKKVESFVVSLIIHWLGQFPEYVRPVVNCQVVWEVKVSLVNKK
jgi:hypothetical protein